MIKRALQDITNVRTSNIKVTIRKEAPALEHSAQQRQRVYRTRDCVAPEYLAYAEEFYRASNVPVAEKGVYQKEEYGRKITPEMRFTLVEWMGEVKADFELGTATYQVAVRLVDSVVLNEKIDVGKKEFQLLGCVSLFVAHKSEECKRRRLQAFVDVCDGAYTEEEFLQMERRVLAAVAFSVTPLLPMHVITKDYHYLGNSICAYASEAVLLSHKYAYMAPRELARFIEDNVSSALEQREVSDTFHRALLKASSLLDAQPRHVHELLSTVSRRE